MDANSSSPPEAPESDKRSAEKRRGGRAAAGGDDRGKSVEISVSGRAESPEDRKQRGQSTGMIRFLRQPLGMQTVALTGLLILAIFHTIVLTKAFLLPVVVALILYFVLSPLVRGLRRWLWLPEPVGAILVIVLLVAAAGFGIYRLAEPVGEWMDKAPRSMRALERKLVQLREPVEQVERAAAEVEDLAQVGGEKKVQEVQIKQKSLSETLLVNTQRLLASVVVIVVLLFFLLVAGDRFLHKLICSLPRLEKPERAEELLRVTERSVSAYLATIALINTGLGVSVFIAMYFLEMPNPLLWGVMAGLFNFVPYLGALTGVAIVGLVSVMTFEATGAALVPPLVYLALTSIEGNFITPMIIGRRFSLSPVVIILWLLLWVWMWGIAGALLAVPMLAVLKILCDNIPALEPIGDILSR